VRDLRLQEMEKAIREAGTLSMEELCRRFDISMHTARRDVAELEKQGAAEKIYGGVTAPGPARQLLPSFQERANHQAEQKRACCRLAAELVRDHEVIFVDSGTTMTALADYLADRKDLTIVTHNLNLLSYAFPYEQLQVIVLPGRLRRRSLSLTGAETVASLRKFNIQKAFMATTGTTENTVTNSFSNEFEIKQTAMEIAQERILLITTEKFGHPGLMNYATFSDFQTIITDRMPEDPWRTALKESGARVLTVEGNAGPTLETA